MTVTDRARLSAADKRRATFSAWTGSFEAMGFERTQAQRLSFVTYLRVSGRVKP